VRRFEHCADEDGLDVDNEWQRARTATWKTKCEELGALLDNDGGLLVGPGVGGDVGPGEGSDLGLVLGNPQETTLGEALGALLGIEDELDVDNEWQRARTATWKPTWTCGW
jgi:hypothetical protein